MSAYSRNLVFAGLSQLLRYASPLLAYPFLTRALDPIGFSNFSLMLTAAMIISQFVEFGFGFLSTRDLSQSIEEEQGRIVGELMIGRLVMLLSTVVIVTPIFLLLNMGVFHTIEGISVTLLLASAHGFNVAWYYMAQEKAYKMALLDTACSLVTLVLVVTFVSVQDDAELAIVFFAAPIWINNALGYALSFRSYGLSAPNVRGIISSIKKSSNVFFLSAITPISNRLAVIYLGIFSSPEQVAFYAVGERIVTAIVNTTIPLVQVTLPRLSRLVTEDKGKARTLFGKVLVVALAFYVLSAAVGAALTPYLLPLVFGSGLAGGALVVMAQLAIVPSSIWSRLNLLLGMVPFGIEKASRRHVFGTAALNIALLPLLALQFGGVGVGLGRALIELVLGLGTTFAIRGSNRNV